MADNGSPMRQDSPLAFRSTYNRKERPRSQVLEQGVEHTTTPGNTKKARRKSAIVFGEETTENQPSKPISKHKDQEEPSSIEVVSGGATDDVRSPVRILQREKKSLSRSPAAKRGHSIGPTKGESEGSSGSSETITQGKRDTQGKGTTSKTRRHPVDRPNVMSFLDSDSPQITSENAQRSAKESSSKTSPEATKSTSSPSTQSASSGTSSSFRDDIFEIFGDHETDRSTSPEHSVDGEPRGRPSIEKDGRNRPDKLRKRSYGTPEMSRGNIQHPHIPPEDLTPRVPNQQFAKPLPRAEKLPMTGYELLASKLSTSWLDRKGPRLRPMYRKFEALNHRLLLHLQDEICELEEQLHRLDATDTQNRRLPNCILPASRRGEYMSGGELQWLKTDILGKIGFKLEQYNRVLSSFRDTQYLSGPTQAEVQSYRNYLGKYAPIVDMETRFLDATDDLVCLGYNDEDEAGDEDVSIDEQDVETPISRSDYGGLRKRRRSSAFSRSDIISQSQDGGKSVRPAQEQQQQQQPHPHKIQQTQPKWLIHISAAVAVAIVLPIMTFLVIPGFVGRMTVVTLVGAGTLGGLVQGKVIGLQASQETCVCLGLYGAVMAVLAAMVD
ncbi:hypothetical protein GGS20DRAFT_483407 [Poronia punctata]|nr:hypothetical protein GGS20DRAFT_483407 [Poronia punctata]